MGTRISTLLGASALGILTHGGAWAQQAPATAVPAGQSDQDSVQSGASPVAAEEVIVTARRRAENLKDVPVAVSVVTPKEIQALNVFRAQDISNIVSGLQAEQGQSGGAASRYSNNRFAIRGQSGSTGVVTYVNEVPNFPSDVFDLSGIQVLKGPQGTLFGNVTTGGAVLLQPQLPNDEFKGYVDVRFGSYRQIDAEFGVGGPIVPGVLSVRLAGVTRTSSGFTRNLYNGARGDGADSQALRLTTKLNIGDFEDVTLVSYGRNADSQRLGIPLYIAGTDLAGKVLPISGVIPAAVAAAQGIACATTCPTYLAVAQQQLAGQAALGKYRGYENAFGLTPVTETAGIINTASYRFGHWLTIKDIFSYSGTDVTSPGFNDIDALTLPISEVLVPVNKGPRVLTNEVNLQAQPLSGLTIVGGYYYQRTHQPTYSRILNSQYGGFLAGANVGYISIASKPESTITGLYGQADWKITDRLAVTGGLRRTHTDNINSTAPNLFSRCIGSAGLCGAIVGASTNNLSSAGNTLPTELLTIPGNPPGLILAEVRNIPTATRSQFKAAKTTYTLAVDYKVSEQVSVYVTHRTGYKPGGFNNLGGPASVASFGPENVTDWEGGIKTRWSVDDFSSTVNLAVYHDKYSDIQRGINIVDPVSGRTFTVTGNVAAATIKGFDLDVTARYKAFDLAAFYSLTDAGYGTYPNTGQFGALPPYSTLDLTQQQLAVVSKHRWAVRPAIRLNELGLDEDIILSANINGRSSFSSGSANGILAPTGILPGRTLEDLRIDWNRVAETNLSAAIGVQNVGNSQKLIQTTDQARTNGTSFGFYQQPRTWYAQLRYSF